MADEYTELHDQLNGLLSTRCSSCGDPCGSCSCPAPQIPALHTYAPEEEPFGSNDPSCLTRFHEVTKADFAVPISFAEIDVEICDSADYAVGQWVWVIGGGFFKVLSRTDATHIRLYNLGFTGNAPPGTVISAGTAVVPMADITGSQTAEDADLIDGDQIANDAICSQHIGDGCVDTSELANEAVTTAKLAPNAVTSAKILNGTILAEDLGYAPMQSKEYYSYTDFLGATAVPASLYGYIPAPIRINVDDAKVGDVYILSSKCEIFPVADQIHAALSFGRVLQDPSNDWADDMFNWAGDLTTTIGGVTPRLTAVMNAYCRITGIGGGSDIHFGIQSNISGSIGTLGKCYITGVRLRPNPSGL